MHPRPVVLSPATPSELLDYILASHTHPTTLLVCWPKKQFLDALIQDVKDKLVPHDGQDDQHPHHALLGAPLMQVAISRHIAMAFVPTVTHLRSYLAAFFTCDSKAPPPPLDAAPSLSSAGPQPPPPLLVYGFLELHRDGTEWSAQGLNTSAAGLVESAARNGLRAAIVEPRKTESRDELEASLGEGVPILNGSKMRDDGTWSGRVVPVRRVLGRWFVLEAPSDNPGGEAA
ncbi:hypothetical protein HRG_001917 [Hirsutella rhossiliensis]|uniref:Uncharacterized protein n=1 Tax=Hirsutella rhossiliensis TaxID=111463 RepID=A0A9P8N2K8_9HYPO|nr:uncharacterized protein HRG_01917 [Hirsutella rhossiliensis]KAH0966508.1 hypothetical protein HRG_01917 [Hirsutella rhossiliensis]